MEVIKIGNIIRSYTENINEISFIIIDIENKYFDIAYDIISNKYPLMKSKGIVTNDKSIKIDNHIESIKGTPLPTGHPIKLSTTESIIENIDDFIFLTKHDVYILDDIQHYREIKLKKIGI